MRMTSIGRTLRFGLALSVLAFLPTPSWAADPPPVEAQTPPAPEVDGGIPGADGANPEADGGLNPDANQAATRAARSLLLQGKYSEALEAYQALPASEAIAKAIGAARCQESVGQTPEAAKRLEDAANAHPDSAELRSEIARLAFERGDLPGAQSAVDEALRLNPRESQARYFSAELKRVTGDVEGANAGYQWLVDRYNEADEFTSEEIGWIGKGAAQYARWNRLSKQFSFLVNELYPSALRIEPEFWPAHLEMGLLYLEKYNEQDALRELKAASKINPRAAEILAALARLALQGYQLEQASKLLDQAEQTNPRSLVARWYRADVFLADFRAQKAVETLEQARPWNPTSAETLGRLAAAYAVCDGLPATPLPIGQAGTRADRLIAEVVEANPHAGEFFLALAAGLDRSRKYPAAAHYYQEALTRAPRLIETRGELGLVLMRLGDEAGAQQALEASFEIDPFNVRVLNSLKVLEVLQGYAALETEHFAIRFDRGQDELLARYAARYLEREVYPSLTKQFGFQPEGRSLFEIFHRAKNSSGHSWFSARMVGLPYIGTVGACAGKMVALASPNDLPKKYNWARVLKHEFVHVLNLQQSNFNIPHWYTEALAVQSEGYPRPRIWDELLAQRVPKGELFDLDSINLGFIRPASSLDWQMAYCQAQLYAQYMLATYGEDALAKMLAAYTDNLDTRAALKRCFDVEQQAFEAGYREYLGKIAAGLTVGGASPADAPMTPAQIARAQAADPENPDLMARLAQVFMARKQYPKAREWANQALAKQPGHPLATLTLARVHLLVGEESEARALLEKIAAGESPSSEALQVLASLEIKAGKFEQALAWYERGAQRSPGDVEWMKAIARIHLKTGNEEKLAEILPRMAELDPDDFTIRKKLAQMALAKGDFAAASKWAARAIEIDVMDAEIHVFWGAALVGAGDPQGAIEEYQAAVQLAPADNAARFALASACALAGDKAQARAALDELLKRDPKYPGADLLLESLAK